LCLNPHWFSPKSTVLLRRQTMQVEARDPFAQGQEVAFVRAVNKTLQALGTRVTTMAPMVQDAFNPVRGGGFDLDELLLVDVFGQFRSYQFHNAPNNTLLTARALAPVEGTAARAFFPPRMSQPARLVFHWLSADDDTILTPEQSPILRMGGPELPGWAWRFTMRPASRSGPL
jgi:hypothetical protein